MSPFGRIAVAGTLALELLAGCGSRSEFPDSPIDCHNPDVVADGRNGFRELVDDALEEGYDIAKIANGTDPTENKNSVGVIYDGADATRAAVRCDTSTDNPFGGPNCHIGYANDPSQTHRHSTYFLLSTEEKLPPPANIRTLFRDNGEPIQIVSEWHSPDSTDRPNEQTYIYFTQDECWLVKGTSTHEVHTETPIGRFCKPKVCQDFYNDMEIDIANLYHAIKIRLEQLN